MDLIAALIPSAGQVGSNLFAIGLFNAGWLAAITISMSSAYAVGGEERFFAVVPCLVV